MQIIILLSLIVWGLINPTENLALLIFVGLIIAVASSTQDITIDALRIEQINENEEKTMAAGAAMAVIGWWTGYKLGGIIAAMPESVIGGAAIIMFGMIASAGIKLVSKSEMNQRNMLILGLSLSFGIGMSLLPDFVKNIPDFGISLKLLLTTGLIPAGLLAFILNAVMAKK